MMNELIMLGTGHAMVTKCYNTCFVIRTGTDAFLVDAGGGNGILKQIDRAGILWQELRCMFLTHPHSDHILGAVWVIRKIASLISEGRYHGNFEIYCHEELAEVLETMCRITLSEHSLKCIGNGIDIHKVKDGEHARINGMDVTFFDIFSAKAKQFGFCASIDGMRLTCLGDEPYNQRCEHYVRGSDWLLSEAFCLTCDMERLTPHEKTHSTALDTARTAQELQVKNLILYHTEDYDLENRKEAYRKEAEGVFQGCIYVPDDLEVIPLQ